MDSYPLHRFAALSIPLLLTFSNAGIATPITGLALVYHVPFDDGTLNPAVDSLGVGAIKPGDAGVSGSMPSWVLEGGGLTLRVTQPASPIAPVSAGAFATPVNFGAGAILGMRAAFKAATGPHGSGTIWAIVLNARTGDEHDFGTETRAGASLQSRGTVARVNAIGASVAPTPTNLEPAVFDTIFSDLATFTLELVIDRVAGTAYEALYLGSDSVFSRSFELAAFTASGGPAISIGPSIAITNAAGQNASVQLLDFKVFAVPEPSTGALLLAGSIVCGLLGIRTKERLRSAPSRGQPARLPVARVARDVNQT